MAAAEYILTSNPSLYDAFALGTAETVEATLLVGGDDDHNEVSESRLTDSATVESERPFSD